jgi:integrase
MARGHVARNVAGPTFVKAPKQQQGKHAAPTPDAMRRLRDALEGERLEPLITVALGAGLRRSEILGLTWEVVDMDGPAAQLDGGETRQPRIPPTSRARRSQDGSRPASCANVATSRGRTPPTPHPSPPGTSKEGSTLEGA